MCHARVRTTGLVFCMGACLRGGERERQSGHDHSVHKGEHCSQTYVSSVWEQERSVNLFDLFAFKNLTYHVPLVQENRSTLSIIRCSVCVKLFCVSEKIYKLLSYNNVC